MVRRHGVMSNVAGVMAAGECGERRCGVCNGNGVLG